MQDRGFDDVMSDIRALNGPFRVFAPAIQAGFTTRLKSEQASIRKIVIRMDTMRRTSYVSAGYLIAEVTAAALMFVLIITDLGKPGPSLFLVGLLSYLLFYLVGLIRDLDNPFEYLNGKPGAADVNLDVLERNEDRLRALIGALDPAPAVVGTAGRTEGAVAMNWMPRDHPSPPGRSRLVTWLLAGLLVAGCGGDDSSGTSGDELTPDPTTVGYAGEYDTAVTLVGSTCAGRHRDGQPDHRGRGRRTAPSR